MATLGQWTSIAAGKRKEDEWKRLDELTRQRTLSGTDGDELDRLYRSATADLAPGCAADPDVIAGFPGSISAARGRLAGTGDSRAA